MVQIPPEITVNVKNVDKNSAAAMYLEGVVNENASVGWEFYRIDSFSVSEAPGCFSTVNSKGAKAGSSVTYYVISFRKPV